MDSAQKWSGFDSEWKIEEDILIKTEWFDNEWNIEYDLLVKKYVNCN